MSIVMVSRCLVLLVVLGSLAVISCDESTPRARSRQAEPAPGLSIPDKRNGAHMNEEQLLVIFLGDSLTAGMGLAQDEAFPALIEAELIARGLLVQVVNVGVSGDTTAGGLRRLGWVLRQRPRVLVVGLGANDGLRGLPLETIEANLREIIGQARGSGSKILLLGMRMPPNYGPEYTHGFAALFPRIAEEMDVSLVPFLLEGVAGRPELNLSDGIHPNARGHERIAENVLPYLQTLLRDILTLKNEPP